MASRKYFLGITAMMMVLFFMFMFSEIVKSGDHDYNKNNYAEVTPIVHEGNEKDADAVKVSFDGSNTSLKKSVSAWCRYTKKNMVESDAAVIVVDSKSLDADKVTELKDKAKTGTVIIFAGFPDIEFLKGNEALKEMMGIVEIKADAADTYGVYLYKGFLLGGEKIYRAEKKDEERYQDFTLTIPWLVVGKGSKTYASGLTEKSGAIADGSPALIWRAVTNDSIAFVIHDDFISDDCIHGVLEACVYEASDFTLTPVVNASVYSVADFALLSEENSEVIKSIYSRTTQSLVKEILWPRLMSFAKRESLKYTCFFNTKLEKATTDISAGNYSFFIREMREIAAEAGLSGNTLDDTLAQKLKEDLAFYAGSGNSYEFTALYRERLESGDIKAIQESGSKLYALTLKSKGDCDYVDASGNIVINATTQNANFYSFKADFASRSLATAIGYSNVLVDMKLIMRPESAADEWQNFSEILSGNLTDYWSKLDVFEQVTASEAAIRTAAYLKNTGKCTKKGRTITIPGSEPGYFLLRTHGEKISDIKNGSYTYLEPGAYIITVSNKEAVEITVE